MKTSPADLRHALMSHPRASGAELCRLLGGINRSTLMRLAGRLDDGIVRRGGSRRSRYALRRPLRGQAASLPLYRIDAAGKGHVAATLDLIWPEGSALAYAEPCPWPLVDDLMSDGWFDGLPYFLLDMRPQGFLGRHFAQRHWRTLAVAEDLNAWSDDDVIHVLATLGNDQGGDLILGEHAYARHLEARRDWEARLIADAALAQTYPAEAERALAQGVADSSAAGEFPKFTALRQMNGNPVAVIVKFSGADSSAAVRRWADLLVCEHLALETLAGELGVPAARSTIYRHAGRIFLEVERFDRLGAHGRLPLCSLASLNGELIGTAGAPWPASAEALRRNDCLPAEAVRQIGLIWWFGRLIANSDMHEGNLSFQPAPSGTPGELRVAPAYDMLPMRYAPQRGGEVPPQTYAPPLPLPSEAEVWHLAAQAAVAYWRRCAGDSRISAGFRKLCRENGAALQRLVD